MSVSQTKSEPCATWTATSTDECFEQVYDDLYRIANRLMSRERQGHTLTATSLVNEAYVRLEGRSSADEWNSRGHFFTAAAETMRRILIDGARAKATHKRRGVRRSLRPEHLEVDSAIQEADFLLDLDALLDELASEDVQAADLIKLRVFGGQSVVEAGQLLGLTRWSAYQLWDFAQSWLILRSRDNL